MSNKELAGLSQIQVTHLTNLISGRWRSQEAESRVAYILGQDVDYLFPLRTRDDLVAMAIAANEEKEAIAQRRRENFARLGIAV
jgi:plasmid maintenance system antidote protein VapI